MANMRKVSAMVLSAAALFGAMSFNAPSADAASIYTCPWTVKYSQTQAQPTTSYQQFLTNWLRSVRQQAPTTQAQPAAKQQVAAKPAPQTTSAAPVAGLTADEQQMLNLVNQERAKAGLKALQADLELTKVARVKSQDLITNDYFAHNSPTYGSPFDMMKKFGITYRTAGENLAGNSGVAAAHTALMNSAGHRANILNGSFTHVGIGIVKGGDYGTMFTQMFVGR